MTEVLLKELSNSDIDWMLATGFREEMTAGAIERIAFLLAQKLTNTQEFCAYRQTL